MHNTHNDEMPGHVRFGDSPEPGVNPWALAMAKDKAEFAAALEQEKKRQQLEKDGFTGVQLDSEIKFDMTASNSGYDSEPVMELSETTQKGPYVPRKINDKDGDGVEDNVHKTQDELDKFRKPVFGAPVQDIHNTKHGNYPGHVRLEDNPEPTGHSNGFTKLGEQAFSTDQQVAAQLSLSQ